MHLQQRYRFLQMVCMKDMIELHRITAKRQEAVENIGFIISNTKTYNYTTACIFTESRDGCGGVCDTLHRPSHHRDNSITPDWNVYEITMYYTIHW
jgi:hypothetical protein